MYYYLKTFLIAVSILFISANAVPAKKALEPIAIYLTWQSDPATTMTIQWITSTEEKEETLHFQSQKNWQNTTATITPMPQKHPYLIHRTELTNLQPDTEYQFRIGENPHLYKFRTMPNHLKEPIRFVVGGDIYHDSIEAFRETNQRAAKTNPHFALLGGDLAYSAFKEEAEPESVDRWLTFLMTWKQTMEASDGRLIPMIPTVGNHDTQGRHDKTPAQASFYYALFAMPGKQGYNVLDFGNYMSIIILDSGHTHSVTGAQAEWLENTLKSRSHVSNKFALYHVPAYPSVRQMDTKKCTIIRETWVPLFEKYGLNVAFENHDHDYKRTVRIKEGKENPKGVLYLGDGAWGVSDPRLPKSPVQAWYLAKTEARRHFILVTIDNNRRKFKAIDSSGNCFDTYETRD